MSVSNKDKKVTTAEEAIKKSADDIDSAIFEYDTTGGSRRSYSTRINKEKIRQDKKSDNTKEPGND